MIAEFGALGSGQVRRDSTATQAQLFPAFFFGRLTLRREKKIYSNVDKTLQ